MKKFMIFLSAFVMLFTVPALAAEETGSINVTLSADNETVDVSDGTFKLYKVADIVKVDNGGYVYDDVYEYTKDFAGCGYALDIEDANLPQELLAWADEADVAAEMSETPAHGKLAFDNLSLGLYLISQDVASDGYYAALPFLVSVPLNEDGTWVYSVDASPKMELVKKAEADQCRLTFYLDDFHTLDPLQGEFVLSNSDGQYAQAGQDVASATAWNPFVVTAYAAESGGDVVWSDEASTFAIPLSGITFNGIGEGSYVLTEVNQPAGYLLPEESIYINVDSDGIATVTSCPYYEEQPLAEASGTAWDGVITLKNVKTGQETGSNPDGNSGNGANGGTSGSGNAKTGDYDFFLYGVLVIGAAVVIVITLCRRTGRSAQ